MKTIFKFLFCGLAGVFLLYFTSLGYFTEKQNSYILVGLACYWWLPWTLLLLIFHVMVKHVVWLRKLVLQRRFDFVIGGLLLFFALLPLLPVYSTVHKEYLFYGAMTSLSFMVSLKTHFRDP